jgi:predicted double-glycine peptidase
MIFPYYKQETNYTCGAAAMRMVLEQCGIKKSEKQLAKELCTNKIRGTWPKNFSAVADKYKLNYHVKRNATLNELKKLQTEGYSIIIGFYYPPEKIDHYSVLKKITTSEIHFWDPYFGQNHKYSITHFMKVWKSDPKFDNEKRWFFAIKN